MKLLIKLLFKNNKLRLYVLGIIFIIASINPFIELKRYLFNEVSITFEKGELLKYKFKIIQFNPYNLKTIIEFNSSNNRVEDYENFDKYIKEKGIETLIPESDSFELEGLFVGDIKCSVLERNDKYVTIKLRLTYSEHYEIYEYKVYFNKKIVPISFYQSYHFRRIETEFFLGFSITFGCLFGIRFIFKIIMKSKKNV